MIASKTNDLHTASLRGMSAQSDTDGLLLYDLDVGGGRVLRVISDPCHKQHPYCCGNGLWTACVELIAVLAGAGRGRPSRKARALARPRTLASHSKAGHGQGCQTTG